MESEELHSVLTSGLQHTLTSSHADTHVHTHKSNLLVERFQMSFFLCMLLVGEVLNYMYEICMSVCTFEHSQLHE